MKNTIIDNNTSFTADSTSFNPNILETGIDGANHVGSPIVYYAIFN